MKKVFLLLTLIAATIGAWASSTNDALYFTGTTGLTTSGTATTDRVPLYKNGNIFSFTGYFTATGDNGFYITASLANDNKVFRPSGSNNVEIKDKALYQLTTSGSKVFQVKTAGWYTISIDQSQTPEVLYISKRMPTALYELGGLTTTSWKYTNPLYETSVGSGIYEGYTTIKNDASNTQQVKFACMNGNDKTLIGATAYNGNINVPGETTAKYWSVYGKLNDSKAGTNDNKFGGKNKTAGTYFVRVNINTMKVNLTSVSKPNFSFSTEAVSTYVGASFARTASSSNSSGAITYWSSNTKVATVNASGQVSVVGSGTVQIWARVADAGSYGSAMSNYTITALPTPDLAFVETTKTVCKNAPAFINPLRNKSNQAASYSSGDTNVATVAADGTITVVGPGKTTITASVEKNSLYWSGSTTFELTVSSNLTPSPIVPIDITETKEVKSITQDYGWTTEAVQPNIAYNGALTLTSTSNPRTVTSFKYLRYYQSSYKGVLTITAKQKAVIKSAKMTYTPQNYGTLTRDYGADGVNIVSDKRVATNSAYTVNANAFSLYTGSTIAGANDGRVDVGTYSVIYTDPTIVFERLQGYSSGTANVDGDNQLYKWSVNAQNHSEDVGAYKGIKLQDGNSIAMSENPEGGIKSVSFDYKVLSTSAIGLNVSAGSTIHNFTHNAADASGRIFTYTHDFSKAENAALTIAMVSGKSAVAVGPIHITPYLLFNVANHAATFNVEDGTKCDLNSALINNTNGGIIEFSVLENTAGGNPVISDAGILDFSSVVRTGTIKVQAAWGSVTTTLTLTINLKNPQVYFKDTLVTEKVKVGYSTQELTIPTDGVRSYKIISGPDGASVDSTGKVTFSAAGDYIIRGKMDAKLPYGEDSAQYKLRVTALNVPALSFAADSVEQPISAGTYQNELTTSVGVGDTTYTSLNVDVATVDTATGLVTLVAAGTTNITAYVAENDSFAAGQKSYFLKVYAMPVISMGNDTNVYLNAPNFIRTASVTAGDGTITYSSSDDTKATVNATTGEVHIVGSGSVTITANMAKGDTCWSGSASYTIEVSSLKMPTASFTEAVVYKNQNDTAFTIAVNTNSDGVKTYESSDTRVASVDNNGKVTFGEKPGQTVIKVKIAANDEWEKIEASYTLNVSSAPIADMDILTITTDSLKKKHGFENDKNYTNIALNDVLTLSKGKYYTESGGILRYYQKYDNPTSFTIQAKAGVIIQTVKFTYISQNDGTLAKKSGTNIGTSDRYVSGTIYPVDANSFTCYYGNKGAGDNGRADITEFEIKYFVPSTGVAVTKTSFDLGKDLGLISNLQDGYQDIKVNDVISLHADKKGTLKYYSDANSTTINCYRWTGAIDIKARSGATIHYVKITYNGEPNGTLTKYYGADGKNIPAIDRIASDSILYVNANSVSLWVGNTAGTDATIGITKIYVNYTDNSEVVVDNFDNCESKGTGSSEDVAGVDGKYDWKFTNFDRDNAQRMYYDQSVKINKNGNISTQYTGGLKEVAFDWHPTVSGQVVNFNVKAGDSTWTVNKTAADMDKIYTFNFQKLNNKTNGEFSITVNSDAAVEVGHVSLTPYLIYTDKADTIAAKDYMKSGYINNTLINYTGQTPTYTVSGENADQIASVDGNGKVSILGGGTVTVNATADGATASYKLTINLETTSASFTNTEVNKVVTDGSYKQKLNIVTDTTAGNVINYEFVGEHDGATLSDSTVTFTKEGTFTIKGRLEQNLPYAAAEDIYVLIVGKPVPHIQFTDSVKSQKLSDGTFSVSLKPMPAGVGALSYNSTNKVVANVDQNGVVTPLKAGVTYIKAYVTEGTEYAADSTSCKVIVLGDPIPGAATVKGNIEEIASQGGWSDGDYRPYFRLDEVISVDDTAKANAYYQDASKSLRYLQNTKKGQFTIRAKAGVIIQSVKLTYTSVNDGVVTNNYGTDGKSIAAANQYLSGVTYKVDANRLVFYTGSTTDNANGEVYIKGIEVNYFKSPVGVAVTKNVIDLAKQYNLKGDTSYMSLALDNVVTMSVSKAGTMKYLDGKNLKELRFYQTNGPVTISAREGAKINYVKVTYSGIDNGVFTTDTCRSSVPVEEQVASDSILYVNAQSISLYPSSSSTNTNGQPRVSKIYVNYTDSKSIVDNFDNCTKIYGGDAATKVMGVDSTFEWEFTQFNRDSLRRIGYDQSTMLRQAGGKIAANNVDGGIKEVSFDWFASNSNQGAKFYVKAGETTDTVQLAATGGWYPRTYTLTDIKTNGAFSIEMDPASGSQMEVGHISLTPYLFYKEKEVNVTVNGTYTNNSLVDYRDSNDAITYESSKDSVASVDPATGLVTANHVGTATITASWNGVSTSYQIVVKGDKTVIALKRNDGTENADTIVNNYGETIPNPSMALPTLTGYRFNAYFPDANASKSSERITVTAWDEKTYWVANVKHSNGTVQMTDSARKWIYEGANYTLYADWKPELTITLNNQDADSAGTSQVKTAHCPYNASVNLSQNITVPVKAGFTFGGYFTAAEGGIQLIDANGAFIASVAGYTNETKMWQKDQGATLYAHWETITITLNEAQDNSTDIAEYDNQVVGKVNLVRTLVPGKYNTFCLPFEISKEDLEEVFDVEITSLSTIDTLQSSGLDTEKKNLNVVIVEADKMEAGKPYLIQVADTVANPSFASVTIKNEAKNYFQSGDVKFYGITSPFTIPGDDKDYLFMSNNKLNWNNTGVDTNMKGLRAYFYVPGMNENAPGVSARLVFNLPSIPTGMDNLKDNDNTRKMIIDNQLIIIRDGKMFNAQGQFVK